MSENDCPNCGNTKEAENFKLIFLGPLAFRRDGDWQRIKNFCDGIPGDTDEYIKKEVLGAGLLHLWDRIEKLEKQQLLEQRKQK